MRKKAHALTRNQGGLAGPLLVTVAAAGLTLVSAFSGLQLAGRLVAFLSPRLRSESIQNAQRTAFSNAPPEARQGLALALISEAGAAALRDPDRVRQAIADAGNYARLATRSQLPRLQAAALRIRALEAANEPVASWWPAVAPYLSGLDSAHFPHFAEELRAAWVATYDALGMPPGMAYELASRAVGHPHGPLLQYLSRVTRDMARQLEASDPAAAQDVERAVTRLLREWVLAPGPAGLRLLAADLLAEWLEDGSLANRAAAEGAPDSRARLAASLRDWRQRYRDEARRRPLTLFAPTRAPALAPAAHEALLRRVGLLLSLAGVLASAGPFSMLFVWPWLARARRASTRWSVALVGALATLAGALLASWLLGRFARDLNLADLRRLYAGDVLHLVAPAMTCALAVCGLLAATLWLRGHASWPARLGAVSVSLLLMSAGAVQGGVWFAESARRHYERETRVAAQDEYAAIAGADAEALLAPLRAWQP